MNPQDLFNVQYGDAYPTNIEYAAAEQQTPQPNTTQIQIYQPQVTYQTIQQVYQPNVQHHVNHQTYQSFAAYQANDQFYQPNVGLNMETRLSTLLPQEDAEQRKRPRAWYTPEQVMYLEEHFKKNPYLTKQTKSELCTTLEIDEQKIKKWYQNRRTKEKANVREANSAKRNENQRQNMWFPSPIDSHGSGFPENIVANYQDTNVGRECFTRNALQHNFYPEARSQEVFFNANESQNIEENHHVLGSQSSNNNSDCSNLSSDFFEDNNLGLTPGGILSTDIEEILPSHLESNQNILDSIEDIIPTIALIPFSQLETMVRLKDQEDQEKLRYQLLP